MMVLIAHQLKLLINVNNKCICLCCILDIVVIMSIKVTFNIQENNVLPTDLPVIVNMVPIINANENIII